MIWDEDYWDRYEQTDEQRARRPWKAAVVHETEIGEQHIYPDDGRHIPEPRCFCGPFIDTENERIWIHRRIEPVKVLETTEERPNGTIRSHNNGQ